MKIKFQKKYFFIGFLLLIILYLFWGPLFPWNPLKLGHEKIESTKATIYITEYDGENVVNKLDELIQEEEEFHGMEFKKKFKIIVLGKESSMKRYLPWLSGTGYSVSMGFLNVIYIGPMARNSKYGIDVFLKHEISHLLIYQNTLSSSNNMEIVNQAWLSEGVATYFGGPHYYEKKDFIKLWEEKGLQFNSLYMENPQDMDKNIIRLKYTYYRFFIEFLIDYYGIEKFQAYLKSYCINPKNYNSIFVDIYNNDLNEILLKFDSYLKIQ